MASSYGAVPLGAAGSGPRRVTQKQQDLAIRAKRQGSGRYDRTEAFSRFGKAGKQAQHGFSTSTPMQRTGVYAGDSMAGGPSGGGAMMATGRPRDPSWYYRQNNVPLEVRNEEELARVRQFCRLLYISHPVVGACTDIYATFPLQGLRLKCKDPRVEEFHSELFLEQLNYHNHLETLNRQHWLSGEIFSLAEWDERLGIWSADTHINPDDVEMQTSLFSNEAVFLMRLPEGLRRILSGEVNQYQRIALLQRYPELRQYADSDARVPVSDVVMKQLMFTGDDFNPRGIPLLLRGMRTLIQEEMLNSALDSIADRLYSPLILSKIGASAKDLGTDVPWVPTPDDLDEFNIMLDMALAADFRALTYHWAIDIQPVFGRENVPDLGGDFDRITERTLMVYGLSQTMLTGANAGETYAADALNRDVVSQRLTNNQRMLARFFRERMAIVAEAHEHFDYEVTRGKRYLKTQEIVELDENGEYQVREVPKLLIPEVEFDTLNLSDEQQEREFVESLAAAGVPIPYRKRIAGTGLNFDEMIEERSTEEVALAVAEAEAQLRTYKALRARNLPIPQDLMDKFRPKALMPDANMPLTGAGPAQPVPQLGQLPTDLPVLAPTPDMLNQAAEDGVGLATVPQANDADDDGSPDDREGNPNVPPESNEQRKGMPKAASLVVLAATGARDEHELQAVDNFVETSLARIAAVRAAQVAEQAGPPERHIEALATPEIPSLDFRVWAMNEYKKPEVDEIDAYDIETRPPVGSFGAPRTAGMVEEFSVPPEYSARQLAKRLAKEAAEAVSQEDAPTRDDPA